MAERSSWAEVEPGLVGAFSFEENKSTDATTARATNRGRPITRARFERLEDMRTDGTEEGVCVRQQVFAEEGEGGTV